MSRSLVSVGAALDRRLDGVAICDPLSPTCSLQRQFPGLPATLKARAIPATAAAAALQLGCRRHGPTHLSEQSPSRRLGMGAFLFVGPVFSEVPFGSARKDAGGAQPSQFYGGVAPKFQCCTERKSKEVEAMRRKCFAQAPRVHFEAFASKRIE